MDFLNLDPLLRQALREDLGRGDLTTESILSGKDSVADASATLVAKQTLIAAGWPVFLRVFQLLGSVEATPRCREGEVFGPGVMADLSGPPSVLLRAERVALNLLQRLCGIATLTRTYVDAVAHTGARILDTRKTTPLWREVEKYAVRMGGGFNHRMGLDDAVLIKENHITIAGGIENAIEACRENVAHLHKIEIEVQNQQELLRAIGAGADIVMLDNMTPSEVREAVALAEGRVKLEVSGGVTMETVLAFAETGVDYVSIGALTHSYRSADISLLFQDSSTDSQA